MIELNQIIHADCMDIMKDIPDKYFELAIVDPPYGIGHDSRGMSNRKSNSKKYTDYGGKIFIGGDYDDRPESKEYFIELKRISKNQIIFGANHFIENIPSANSSSYVVWHKNGQNPNSTNADCELAYTSFKTSVKYFYYEWSGFGFINNGEKNKFHPNQKPVALYKWLLKNYAKTGDKILDTHSGSGTCAVACIDMGFEYLCIEKDKDYFEASVKRIEKENIKLKLAI